MTPLSWGLPNVSATSPYVRQRISMWLIVAEGVRPGQERVRGPENPSPCRFLRRLGGLGLDLEDADPLFGQDLKRRRPSGLQERQPCAAAREQPDWALVDGHAF